MNTSVNCPLCGVLAVPFARTQRRRYFACSQCKAIFMDPAQYPSLKRERKRYAEHENDVNDADYQAFVSPLVEAVKTEYAASSCGLDYGSGTGPVAAKLLCDEGYIITTYDPFFDQKPSALDQQYDFIICSEVIEHFHQPDKEFGKLKMLLHPGGHLYCMTLRYTPDIDFRRWYYKNDETHVIFYRDETARYIKKAFGFSDLRLKERLIILQK